MSLATATWIPGFEIHEAPRGGAGPYSDLLHVKFVWHTTESAPGSIMAIVDEMLRKNHTDVYHALADPVTLQRVQLLPLNIAASALAHPPSVETNHDGAIQMCIVGRATNMPNLTAAQLTWLGTDVLAPVSRMVPELPIDTKAQFYGDHAGFTIASANARQRMAPPVWDNFSGQAGHQHVPGNDHWDPGALDVSAITRAAHAVLSPSTVPTPGSPQEDDVTEIFINPKSKNPLRPQYAWIDVAARELRLEGGLRLKGIEESARPNERYVSVPTSGAEIKGADKHEDGMGVTVVDVKRRAYVYRWA